MSPAVAAKKLRDVALTESEYRTIVELLGRNPNDVELTLRALKKHNFANNVKVVKDGAEALDFIFATGAYADRKVEDVPKVIFLDLKLPKIDGMEVLRRIKSDPRTKTIPVVVLTSSEAETDIARAYELYANCYVTKPVDIDHFLQVVKSIEEFWVEIVRLPSQ